MTGDATPDRAANPAQEYAKGQVWMRDEILAYVAEMHDEDGDGKLSDTSIAWLRGWNAALDAIEEKFGV